MIKYILAIILFSGCSTIHVPPVKCDCPKNDSVGYLLQSPAIPFNQIRGDMIFDKYWHMPYDGDLHTMESYDTLHFLQLGSKNNFIFDSIYKARGWYDTTGFILNNNSENLIYQ